MRRDAEFMDDKFAGHMCRASGKSHFLDLLKKSM